MINIVYKPIGVVHSPFTVAKGTPAQPVASQAAGTIELLPELVEGLIDLDGFSHIIVIYHLHLSAFTSLTVVPFLDTIPHGVFATRSPSRPNGIGFSVVELNRIEGNILYINDIDMLDGTPVLDIKPFVPVFDVRQANRTGWFTGKTDQINDATDDGRFAN